MESTKARTADAGWPKGLGRSHVAPRAAGGDDCSNKSRERCNSAHNCLAQATAVAVPRATRREVAATPAP